MGRTSRQKYADQALKSFHAKRDIFDEVDRELRRSRRRVLFPYVFAAIAIFWLIILAVGVSYASWVFGGGY